MKDKSFTISLIGFLLIMEGIGWIIFSIVPFSSLLKLQVYLLGPGLHAWVFSEKSLDLLYLLFFRNPLVLVFGGLVFLTTGAGLIMLKKWARLLLMLEASLFIVLAFYLVYLGGRFGIGWIFVWGLVLFYASRPSISELFRQGWQDYSPDGPPGP